LAREYGVEEWLPGGIARGATAAAEANGVEFTVDLNQVDFDGLVGLGISVGQAARFISQRERRGGISGLSDLDGFSGLAPGVHDILRRNGRV